MRSDRLLLALIGITALFGASMLLLPGATRSLFGLVMYGDAARIESFGSEARAYATLLHGVLGAVMVGWAVALWGLLGGPGVSAAGAGWRGVGLSVGAWYLLDSGFSAAVGAWPNVVLNTGFAVAFAAGIAVARRPRQSSRTE